MQRGLAESSTLPPIRDRTRWIVGDVLSASFRDPDWRPDWVGDSVSMSSDPVAHDAVRLQTFRKLLGGDRRAARVANSMATLWLANGTDLGLRTNHLQHIDLVDTALSQQTTFS